MPDKWEYPWFAAWDLAFHVIPLAMIVPDCQAPTGAFDAEWYMHPNGQIPAYEWVLVMLTRLYMLGRLMAL